MRIEIKNILWGPQRKEGREFQSTNRRWRLLLLAVAGHWVKTELKAGDMKMFTETLPTDTVMDEGGSMLGKVTALIIDEADLYQELVIMSLSWLPTIIWKSQRSCREPGK